MENAAIGTGLTPSGKTTQPRWIRRARAIINTPPAVVISGQILFWLFMILFGHAFDIHVLKGKRHMPPVFELLGWIFLFGTAVNFLVYPVIWLLLYIFKEPLAARARYFVVVWVLSGLSLWLLWPYIYWFMD